MSLQIIFYKTSIMNHEELMNQCKDMMLFLKSYQKELYDRKEKSKKYYELNELFRSEYIKTFNTSRRDFVPNLNDYLDDEPQKIDYIYYQFWCDFKKKNLDTNVINKI